MSSEERFADFQLHPEDGYGPPTYGGQMAGEGRWCNLIRDDGVFCGVLYTNDHADLGVALACGVRFHDAEPIIKQTWDMKGRDVPTTEAFDTIARQFRVTEIYYGLLDDLYAAVYPELAEYWSRRETENRRRG